MRKTFLYLLASTIMAAMLMLASCSDDDDNPNGPGGGTPTRLRVINVSPADQAQGVATTTPISLKFNVAADTALFNENFFVTGGPEMLIWVDSLSTGLSTGTVDYDELLTWLDSVSMTGTLSWNDARDSVTFTVDSSFAFDTDYMIYLHNAVRGSRGERMRTDSLAYGSFASFFRTAPPASASKP